MGRNFRFDGPMIGSGLQRVDDLQIRVNAAATAANQRAEALGELAITGGYTTELLDAAEKTFNQITYGTPMHVQGALLTTTRRLRITARIPIDSKCYRRALES